MPSGSASKASRVCFPFSTCCRLIPRKAPGSGDQGLEHTADVRSSCRTDGSLLPLMGERQESEGPIDSSEFEGFFARSERPVRFALSARFGFDVGREATAEALTYAWEHWDRVRVMENPVGYVYRVGTRFARRMASRPLHVDFPQPEVGLPEVEPKLASALSRLSQRQRTSVVLVHGLGWTYQETADLLGLSRSSVQKHVDRGVERLRRALGVDIEQ